MKFLVLFFVLYLLFEEFVSFVIVKPTQSSIGESKLIPKYNPKILICMTPAYEVDGFRWPKKRWHLPNFKFYIAESMNMMEVPIGILLE